MSSAGLLEVMVLEVMSLAVMSLEVVSLEVVSWNRKIPYGEILLYV